MKSVRNQKDRDPDLTEYLSGERLRGEGRLGVVMGFQLDVIDNSLNRTCLVDVGVRGPDVSLVIYWVKVS